MNWHDRLYAILAPIDLQLPFVVPTHWQPPTEYLTERLDLRTCCRGCDSGFLRRRRRESVMIGDDGVSKWRNAACPGDGDRKIMRRQKERWRNVRRAVGPYRNCRGTEERHLERAVNLLARLSDSRFVCLTIFLLLKALSDASSWSRLPGG